MPVLSGGARTSGSYDVPSNRLRLKSLKLFLDTVSTGSDSDLVNDEESKSLGHIVC